MKYVDNLLEVKPEEIRCKWVSAPIQAIVRARNPHSEDSKVVVVFEDGSSSSYTIDGRSVLKAEQAFIFRPKKVKKLKPLHVILQEHPNYYVSYDGSIHAAGVWRIRPEMLVYFGNKLPKGDTWRWDQSWTEEVEE